MEHEEIIKKIDELDEKIDAIYISAEKTRKYFLFIVWITIIAIVLPLIGLVFAAPSFLDSYSSLLTL
jgi:hypothetical protein